MPKIMTRPFQVDAIQFTGDNFQDVKEWLKKYWPEHACAALHLLPDGKDGVLLETGAFKLPVGHWFVNEIGYGIATYNNKYFFRRFEIVEEETDA